MINLTNAISGLCVIAITATPGARQVCPRRGMTRTQQKKKRIAKRIAVPLLRQAQ